MKFHFKRTFRKTIIQAEIEHEEERQGCRAQAPYREITLVNDRLIFEHRIRRIHPDLLGLLCMVSFYPFMKRSVTFPKAVSTVFQKAFSSENLPLCDKVNGIYQPVKPIEITNVDPDLEPYFGRKLSISYGGGFDSLATQLLFPESVVVHESSRLLKGRIRPDNSDRYLKKIKSEGKQAYNIVNNQRYCLNRPEGWSTWPACASNAILLATDKEIGYIMTGTTIDAKFLNNQGRFLDATLPEHLNPWNKAFDMIGLKLFSPVWGISEAATLKIVGENGMYDYSAYCDKDQGRPCHRCFKCFRKATYAHATGVRKFPDEYWEKYNNPKIHEQLYRKPLHGANGWAFSLRHLEHIDWIYKAVKDLPDTSQWTLKSYQKALSIMPPELIELISSRLNKYVEPLENPHDLENWDANV
jgi:hypothetical protein